MDVEVRNQLDHLNNLILVTFGITIWETVNTMRVEQSLRTSFHWADGEEPCILPSPPSRLTEITAVYLLCRYSTFLFILLLSNHPPKKRVKSENILILCFRVQISLLAF